MTRIGLVSDFYAPRIGGLELHMRDLARELTVRGHEVVVFTATHGEPVVDNIRVRRIGGARLPGTSFVCTPSALRELEDQLRAEHIDVLHCHSAFSPLALAAARLGRRHRIPSVLTEHSVLKGLGYALLDCAERMLGWGEWPDVLTAVSSYVARELAQVTNGREVRVLPNGVRLEEWNLPHQDPEQPLIVSVMRFMPRKRPLHVVRMIPQIRAAVPAALRPRFMLIGDGPEMKRVRREAARLGVTPYLDLPGWLPRAEIQKILARASLFILPTSKEALSIATLEAMCAGVPAVAYGHGGVGDIVTDGKEGFLASDSQQFADRVVQLVMNRSLRDGMAAHTRTAAGRFAWDRVIERHLEIYALAADRRRLFEREVARP